MNSIHVFSTQIRFASLNANIFMLVTLNQRINSKEQIANQFNFGLI